MLSDLYVLAGILCGLVLFIILLLPVLAVWFWMLLDWSRRIKYDPDAGEPYKVQMIVGWPFGYYKNVYRKQGPAK